MTKIVKLESNKFMESLLQSIAEEERYAIIKKHLGGEVYDALRSNNIFSLMVAKEKLLYKSDCIKKTIKENALSIIEAMIKESNISADKLKKDLIEYAEIMKEKSYNMEEYYKFSANSRRYVEDLFFKDVITKEDFQVFIERGLNHFFKATQFGIEFNFEIKEEKLCK